jgi:hypothetical protein
MKSEILRINDPDSLMLCRRVAGFLAEHSVTKLLVRRSDGSENALTARDCDLPGLLVECVAGARFVRLRAPEAGLKIEVEAHEASIYSGFP